MQMAFTAKAFRFCRRRLNLDLCWHIRARRESRGSTIGKYSRHTLKVTDVSSETLSGSPALPTPCIRHWWREIGKASRGFSEKSGNFVAATLRESQLH